MWWLINLSGLSKIKHGRKHKFSPGISQPTELRIEISRVCLDGKHSCGFSQSIFLVYSLCVCDGVCVCEGVCALPNRKLTKFPTLCRGARYLYSVHSPALSLTLPLSISPTLFASFNCQQSREQQAARTKTENSCSCSGAPSKTK